MQIAVKEMLHLLRRNSAAGIRHAEQQLAAAFFQFHRDRAAGRRKFQRIGQQMIQELLHGAGVNRADAALHGADEFQVDPQHLRQIAGAFADLANQLYQICVPQRGRLRCSQIFSGGKAVHQPQQPVKALIQHCGLGIQHGILFPRFRRNGLRRGKVEVAEQTAHLIGKIGEQRGQIFLNLTHGKHLLSSQMA